MPGNVTFNNIKQVMLDTLDSMYLVCLGIALLIIFLSIYRNYKEFGEYMGLKYMAGILLAVVFMTLFPNISDYLFRGMLRWGGDAGKRVEETVKVLLSVEVEGGWFDAIVVGLANLVYHGAIWIGRFLRDIMILVCCGLFIILKTLSPIFIAFLTVPEVKSIGVNFLVLAFGFIMTPLCMVFGDLTMVWTICQLWEHTGMAAAVAGGAGTAGAAGSALAVLAANPPGAIIVAAGAAGVLFAFACVFILLCVVMYIGIPWACISLFRGAGVGNALAMSLNTASNVMSMAKTAQAGRTLGKSITDSIKDKGKSSGESGGQS